MERCARNARWWNVLLLAALVGMAANVKFSGLMLGPIVAICLFVVALIPNSWFLFGRRIESRLRKLFAAVGISFICAGSVVLITWASYGFRYAPTPDPDRRLSIPLIVEAVKAVYVRTETFKLGEEPTHAQIEAFSHNMFVRSVLFANDHRLMPHAWLMGLLWTYATTLGRTAFLDGQISEVGWWYYFPLAMLYKTPTATLAAFALAVMGAVMMRRWGITFNLDRPAAHLHRRPRRNLRPHRNDQPAQPWPAAYFPIYPFLYMLVAIVAVRALTVWPTISRDRR